MSDVESTTEASERCPGCLRPLDGPGDCGHCEYFNLASGRYHYCGRDGCHCRNLRGTMQVSVLRGFADDFAVKYGGREYKDMAAERLGYGAGS